MRVRLIYRKDLHTSEVGTIELDSPGPLVAVHTAQGELIGEANCIVYGLSYHCHEQRCKCGTGDKILLVERGENDKVSLDIRVPDRVRTIGESVAAACTCCTCKEVSRMGHALDREIMGAEAVGTVYDEKANIEDVEPAAPVMSKSVQKRIAAQSRGRAKKRTDNYPALTAEIEHNKQTQQQADRRKARKKMKGK